MTTRTAQTLVASLCLTFTAVSHATSYAPPTDFEADSPNGEFRFVADFPDLIDIVESRSATIRYSLFEKGIEDARWVLLCAYQPELTVKDWPGRAYGAYVGDDGEVLIYGPEQTNFIPLAAADGAVGSSLNYEFKPPYPRMQSGNRWIERDRIMRFMFRAMIEVDGKSLLLTRVSWGERQLIDPAGQRLIKILTPAQIAASNAAERQWAQRTLRDAPERMDVYIKELIPWVQQAGRRPGPDPRRPQSQYEHDLQTAMQMAGRFGYSESIPELRAIEQWRPAIPEDHGLGENDLRSLQSRGRVLLRTARLSLRRLGERPTNHQPLLYSFHAWTETTESGTSGGNEIVFFPERILFSDADADSIIKGMPVSEVIEILGAPDWMSRARKQRCQLEFDIDSDKPYTLRITYQISDSVQIPPVVTSVERITPPRWTIETARDFEIDWQP